MKAPGLVILEPDALRRDNTHHEHDAGLAG
jgi:hypothetical protein